MKAKKFIENKKEGEYEFIKNHVVDIEVSNKDIDDIWDYLDIDDPEEAYETWGVSIYFDDSIYSIDLQKLVEQIDEWAEDNDAPDWFMDIVRKLRDYKGYDLYPDNDILPSD